MRRLDNVWNAAADLPLVGDTPAVEWLVEGIVPLLGATSIFGPPKAGKTHLGYSIAGAAAAAQKNWFAWGLNADAVRGRKVWIITDEITSKPQAARLLDRVHVGRPDNLVIVPAYGRAIMLLAEKRTQKPGADGVATTTDFAPTLTKFGKWLWQMWLEEPPALVMIDSETALIRGLVGLNQESAIVMASGLDSFALSVPTCIISTAHTSQDSLLNWNLPRRLGYSARTGSQGVPAGYSSMIGVTKWRAGEFENALGQPGVNPAAEHVIAMATAALRDGEKVTDELHPAVFKLSREHGLELTHKAVDLLMEEDPRKTGGKRRGAGRGSKGGDYEDF